VTRSDSRSLSLTQARSPRGAVLSGAAKNYISVLLQHLMPSLPMSWRSSPIENVGAPGAALVDIFDLQRAPVTWFDDLPLAGEGLEWADKLDCSIATGLAVALARRESPPLLSFDPLLTAVPDITFLRLSRPTR
jgi:hypothetical protein